MKRLTAWILVIALSVCALPLDAIAQNQYEKNFVVLSNTGKEEKEFREWAAKLVDVYRNDYAMVTDDNTFTQDSYLFYERKDSAWSLYKDVFDDCLYHPYYEAAQKKQEYNFSKEANAQHEGDTVKETEYTLMDDQELIGVYMWIIRETIQEKAKVDPMFFMQEIEGNERYYSYSVKDGVMVFDPELKNLQDVTNANMVNDIGGLAVSALGVAIDTFFAYEEVKNKGLNALEKAKDGALQQKDFGKAFKENLEKECKTILRDFVTGCTDDMLKEVNNRFVQSMNAVVRTQATLDLLNSMLDCNENIVAYLKSTYVENKMMIADEKFADTVQAVITVLESPEFEDALQNKAEITVTDQVVQQMMSEAGVKLELPKDTLLEALAWSFLNSLCSSLIDLAAALIDSAIEAFYESFTSKKDNYKSDEKLAGIIKDCGKKIVSDLEKRIKNMAKSIIQAIKDEEWSDEKFDTIYKEQFEGLNAKSQPLNDFFEDLFWDTAVSVLTYSIFGTLNGEDKKESTSQSDKTLEERLNLISTTTTGSSGETIFEFEFGGESITGRQLAVVIGVIWVRECIKGLKSYVKRNGTEFTPDEIADITEILDRFEKVFGASQNLYLADAGDSKVMENYYNIVNEIIHIYMEMIEIGSEDEDLMRSYMKLFNSLFTEKNGQYGIFTVVDFNALKAYVNKDFISLILKMVFGGTISDADSELAKEAIKDGDDLNPQGFALLTSMIDNSVNAIVEDAFSIVSSVWDSMMTCSKDLLKAWHSACGNAAGENNASLIAERMRIVYEQSKDLEAMNLQYTLGGRWESYNNFNSYSDYLAAWVNDRYDSSVLYRMNAQDITYYDEKMQAWILTPDINDVKVLTDYILTQMHLDAVGFGAYLALLKERDEYATSPLFSKYYKKGVLIEQQQAIRRQQTMIRIINNAENTRP